MDIFSLKKVVLLEVKEYHGLQDDLKIIYKKVTPGQKNQIKKNGVNIHIA